MSRKSVRISEVNNFDEFGGSSPKLSVYKISSNPPYATSNNSTDHGPVISEPVFTKGTPCVYTETSTEGLESYHDDDVAGIRMKIIFFLGIFFPFCWFLAVYYRHSKSKVVSRWKRYCYIGLIMYIALILCIVWLGLVIAFNLSRIEDVPFSGRMRVYYVNDAFVKSVKMEFGEFLCLLIGPILFIVVLYDPIASAVRYITSGAALQDIKRLVQRD